MSYDPRTSKDFTWDQSRKRGAPVLSEPVTKETEVKPVAPGQGSPIIPVALVPWLTILAVIAGAVAALPTAGVALPPIVVGIATLVATTLAALGIASPGWRKKEKD